MISNENTVHEVETKTSTASSHENAKKDLPKTIRTPTDNIQTQQYLLRSLTEPVYFQRQVYAAHARRMYLQVGVGLIFLISIAISIFCIILFIICIRTHIIPSQ